MMTAEQLEQWLETFKRLEDEMSEQSPHLHAAMSSIRGSILAANSGNDRPLRELYDFTRIQALSFLALHGAAKDIGSEPQKSIDTRPEP